MQRAKTRQQCNWTPNEMSAWAGYLGSGNQNQLRLLLADDAQMYIGKEFGLGVYNSGGEPATLVNDTNHHVTASIGYNEENSSSASITLPDVTLSLARDVFGFHGAYIVQGEETLWFASDPRLLQRLSGPSNEIDPAALHTYLCFSYVPTPLTLTRGISALPCGTRMTMTLNGERRDETLVTWRELPTLKMSEATAIKELREQLRKAVLQGVGNAQEAGVFLSGGIDSSLVAALLVEGGVKTSLFTLDFGSPYNVELPYAKRVATHLKQPLTIVPAHPADARKALVATASALELPFGDGVTVPLYLLGQVASKQVKVVFNGEGGDQLFGGWTNKPMIAAELYRGTDYDREAAYLKGYHRFYDSSQFFYTQRAQELTSSVDVGAWIRPALNGVGFMHLLHRLRAANLWLKGAQNIVPRAAQLATVHGLCVRSPFFDRSLTEWTFSLSPEWFLQGACEKYLLKRVAEFYFPSEVVWREKRGMGVPTTEWSLGPLRWEISHLLNRRCLKRNGWFEPKAVSALRKGQGIPVEFRRRRIGEKLWALLMLHLWCEVQEQSLIWPTSI